MTFGQAKMCKCEHTDKAEILLERLFTLTLIEPGVSRFRFIHPFSKVEADFVELQPMLNWLQSLRHEAYDLQQWWDK